MAKDGYTVKNSGHVYAMPNVCFTKGFTHKLYLKRTQRGTSHRS